VRARVVVESGVPGGRWRRRAVRPRRQGVASATLARYACRPSCATSQKATSVIRPRATASS